MRSGTQNVPGIVGCAAAIKNAGDNQPSFAAKACKMRDRLYEELAACKGVKPSVSVPADSGDFLPHIVNVCVRGHESQTLFLQLDLRGFCVSGGSACSSGSLDPSHVLSAIGIERNLAQGSLRVSFGEFTQEEDVDAFLNAFKEVIR